MRIKSLQTFLLLSNSLFSLQDAPTHTKKSVSDIFRNACTHSHILFFQIHRFFLPALFLTTEPRIIRSSWPNTLSTTLLSFTALHSLRFCFWAFRQATQLPTQCYSYRRFFASWDASSSIWTQVESFGRFLCVKIWCQTLKNWGFGHIKLKFFPRKVPRTPGILFDAS